jgi:hypothetical protein
VFIKILQKNSPLSLYSKTNFGAILSDNLPVIKQTTTAVLSKTKNLMSVANKILTNKTSLPQEVIEEWIRVLRAWADECNIPHSHLPRDRAKLLALIPSPINLIIL